MPESLHKYAFLYIIRIVKKTILSVVFISTLCLNSCESSSDDVIDSPSSLPNVSIISNDVDSFNVFLNRHY